MDLLDMKTVILTYAISNFICLVVIVILWGQNRKRFAGLGFWLADFALQFFALVLVILRGSVPDILSMTVSNVMVVGGTILLTIGLGHFTGSTSRQIHNYILLALFAAIHACFVYVYPSLPARNILISLGLLAICSQGAWLMLRKVSPEMRPATRGVGYVFLGFCLTSLVRLGIDLVVPAGSDFFESTFYDTFVMIVYQMLFIVLTFSLFLLVNNRLFAVLRDDIFARTKAEQDLAERVKELKCIYDLSNLINTPDLSINEILRGSVELLPPAMRFPGFAGARLVLWEYSYATSNYQDTSRKLSCEILRDGLTIGVLEICYRDELPLEDENPFLDEEAILLQDVAERLGRVAERQAVNDALRNSEERYQAFVAHSFEAIYRTEFDHPVDTSLPVEEQIDQIYANAYMAECNQATADMYNQPSVKSLIGMRLLAAHGGSDNPLNRAAFRKFIEGGYKSENDETVELDGEGRSVWFLSNTIGFVENGRLVRMWGTSINITDRKLTEEALRQSEEKFFKAFQTSPDAVTISRLRDGYFVDVNDGFCRLTGYTRQEALASSSVALRLWADPQGREKYVAALQGEKQIRNQEFAFRTKSGEILDCLCSAEIIKLGGVAHILSVIRDITESKRVQKALQESEAIFSSFLEHSPVYVFFKDKDVRVLRLSRNYEQMLGVPVSEAIGKTMDDLFPSDLAKSMVADDLRILKNGQKVDVVEEMNGRIYETTKFPIFKDGKPDMLAGFTLDITERKQMDAALRESEARYRSILQTALDGYLEVDAQGCIVQVNDAYCRMSGYSEEEILGRMISDFDADESPERAAAHMQQMTVQGGDRFETRHRRKDGSIFDVEVSVQYLDGRFVGFLHDITERKQAAAVLERQNSILAALQQTTFDLLSELDLDILLQNIVTRAGYLMGTTAGYLDLVEPETGQLKPRVGLGALAESLDHIAELGEGVAGTVWQTGKPLIINDYDRWSGRIGNFSRSAIRSIIGVPLLSRGNVVGVLGLAHEASSDRLFTEEDGNLLTQFARLVTIAIDNARLYFAAQQELAERKRAEAIIALRLRLWEFSATHSVEELMQKALDEIGEITGSPIGFYHFVEDDQNTLSLKAWSTRTRAEFCKAEGGGMHYPIDQAGVWVDCVRERKPVIHNDYASLPHRKGMPEGHATVVRELVVPTMRGDRVVSILGIGNKSSDYEEQDVELVVYIADIIWTIIEQKQAEEQIRQLNIRLEQMAMTDELTGLPNRRAFFIQGDEEIKRVQRYKTALSLIMLDVDGFKRINDTYGHDNGDLALQCLAEAIRDNIRETDTGARLGGEEFAILLPNTGLEDAVGLAERLRLAIEEKSCQLREKLMRITVSVGVAAYGESKTPDLDAVLHNADAAMYRAKDLGRNRVVLWEEGAKKDATRKRKKQ